MIQILLELHSHTHGNTIYSSLFFEVVKDFTIALSILTGQTD